MARTRSVLVTGASSGVGWHVARDLRRAGWAVRALLRPDSDARPLRDLGVDLFVGDLLGPATLVAPLRGVSAVVHLAGRRRPGTPEAYRRINVDGTQNLLDAVEREAPGLERFVFVSSLAAVGPTAGREPPDEDAAPHPRGAFGRTKLEAEAHVLERQDRFPVTVFRPAVVYGPRDRSLLPYFRFIRAGLMPMLRRGDMLLSVVHAADVAGAVRRALMKRHPSGSLYFVSDGPPRKLRDLAEAIRLAQETPAVRVSVPRGVLAVAESVGRSLVGYRVDLPDWLHPDGLQALLAPGWTCDDARIRRDLEWSPAVSLRDGLAQTVASYRAAGWLPRPWRVPAPTPAARS